MEIHLRATTLKRYAREKVVVVCAIAFLVTVAIIVASDLFDVPGLMSGVLHTSREWLRDAINVGFFLVTGATATWLISRLVLERRESEAKYATLVERASDGINIVQDGRLVYSSPRMFDIVGYRPEDVLGRPLLDFIAPADRSLVADLYQRRISGEAMPTRYEIGAVAKDGRIVPIEVSSCSIEYHGRPAVMAVIRDATESRKADEALRLEKENFHNSLEVSPMGIQIISSEGDLVYANRAVLDMWGYASIEEINGVPLEQRVTPETYVSITQIIDERRQLGDSPTQYQHESTIVRKDGQLRHVQTYRNEIVWDGRKCAQILYEDITERKKVEEALLFKTALLEAQAETTIDGILVVNEKREIVFSNRRFQEMWQVPPLLLERKDDAPVLRHVLYQVREPEAFLEKVQYLYDHELEESFEERELKDGRVFERYSAPLVDSNGVIRGRIFYFRDITEPSRMRQSLERAAKEWRATFDSITDLISIHDRENRIVRVNKAFAGRLGTTPKELIGKKCHEMMHGTPEPPVNCPLKQTLETSKPATTEVYQREQGSWLQESTSPMFGDNGEIVGAVHIIKDVTERKQLEQQLMMTDRLASIGELVSGIAHELNNPLTGVIGFSQLLMEKELADDIREDLNIVSSEAQRAARIVKNLLTFARKHAPVKQASQINSVIDDVLRLRTYGQNVNNIEVVRNLAPDLPEITADYFQIQQVFLNIIINGEYFMVEAHNRGKLTITTERFDGVIRASFADDGPGIARENLSRIFNPFFTTKDVGKGTGLGLSICHGIVTEHGGRIYAQSEPGKGATFVVELPVDKPWSAGGGQERIEVLW